MTDDQLAFLFAIERDAEGRPKLRLPEQRQPTAQEMFERRLYLLGVTEPEVVSRLWRERQEKLARQQPPRPAQRRRRR